PGVVAGLILPCSSSSSSSNGERKRFILSNYVKAGGWQSTIFCSESDPLRTGAQQYIHPQLLFFPHDIWTKKARPPVRGGEARVATRHAPSHQASQLTSATHNLDTHHT
ncbi:unnamed protein product, partial [Ectocarpus sp. 8 AP-2014]